MNYWTTILQLVLNISISSLMFLYEKAAVIFLLLIHLILLLILYADFILILILLFWFTHSININKYNFNEVALDRWYSDRSDSAVFGVNGIWPRTALLFHFFRNGVSEWYIPILLTPFNNCTIMLSSARSAAQSWANLIMMIRFEIFPSFLSLSRFFGTFSASNIILI